MTDLHALRLAAAEQAEGELKRLLTWAELHIGDQSTGEWQPTESELAEIKKREMAEAGDLLGDVPQ